MAGASFGVMFEEGGGSNSTVRALKAEIEEVEGAPCYGQELFCLLRVRRRERRALLDDFEIETACVVALCVKPEAVWEWDAASELGKDKVFELSGPNSIATKIDQDQDSKNFMVVGRAMGVGTGKHTISMKLVKGSAYDIFIHCCVVRDGAPCNEWHATQESTDSWFMWRYNGGLIGNGKYNDDSAGRIKPGQILTMQVDTDAGTLKFWLDGKPHGPGYSSGVTGPLRWATNVYPTGSSVEIVPTPELQ